MIGPIEKMARSQGRVPAKVRMSGPRTPMPQSCEHWPHADQEDISQPGMKGAMGSQPVVISVRRVYGGFLK